MADTIGGKGLFIADDALEALVQDPNRHDSARSRFDKSPPRYKSPRGSPTRSPSPDLRTDEERRREERQLELHHEHYKSIPYHQYIDQISEERKNLIQDDDTGRDRIPIGGIWNVEWDANDTDRWTWTWKHQQDPEFNAWRPFHQFIFQVNKKREGLELDFSIPDIYTRAYDDVKSTWIKRGIWNMKWGMLPGMTWKHEQPLDDILREEFGEGNYTPSMAPAHNPQTILCLVN
ncbi:hypothetical protein F5Y16DRAFT_402802 [Xylariaceae sp. FL0255]|nr:hypothetical protein F5Y16DRAFT_402802 [Xylariaceae sp. FL0255]